jgi:hypothetical protein
MTDIPVNLAGTRNQQPTCRDMVVDLLFFAKGQYELDDVRIEFEDIRAVQIGHTAVTIYVFEPSGDEDPRRNFRERVDPFCMPIVSLYDIFYIRNKSACFKPASLTKYFARGD